MDNRLPIHHTMSVTMIARNALLKEGDSTDGHRGIWFYDPTMFLTTDIQPGDSVTFECCGVPIAWGTIMQVSLLAKDYPDFCTKTNTKGFRWVDRPAPPFFDTWKPASKATKY